MSTVYWWGTRLNRFFRYQYWLSHNQDYWHKDSHIKISFPLNLFVESKNEKADVRVFLELGKLYLVEEQLEEYLNAVLPILRDPDFRAGPENSRAVTFHLRYL